MKHDALINALADRALPPAASVPTSVRARAASGRTPPKLDPLIRIARNQVKAYDTAGAVSLGNRLWQATATERFDGAPLRGCEIGLRLDGLPAALFLPDPLTRFCPEAKALPMPLRDLPEPHRALVLEHLLTPMLEPLETALGCEITIDALRLAQGYHPAQMVCGWEMQAEDSDGPVTVYLSSAEPDGLAAFIAKRYPKHPPPPVVRAPVEVTFCAGLCQIGRSALAQLEPGDVVFPDQSWTRHRPILQYLIWAGQIAPVQSAEGGLQLAAAPQELKTVEQQVKDEMRIGQGKGFRKPGVLLRLELGRSPIAAETFDDLSAGQTLPLAAPDRPALEALTLATTKGAHAKAQLVTLGDRVGLQITDLLMASGPQG